MQALSAFGFRSRTNKPLDPWKVKSDLRPLVHNHTSAIYVNATRGTLVVCADATGQEVSLGANHKFMAPEGMVWRNLYLVMGISKLVVLDTNLVKIPKLSPNTSVVKCVGGGIKVVKHTKYIHRLNVLGNPVSRIRFAHGMKKIKINKQCGVCDQLTYPVPSLQFMCIRRLPTPTVRLTRIKAMNIKYVHRTCAFCGHRTLCETFYVYGVIKCVACCQCRLRRVQPLYSINDLDSHVVLTPGAIFVTVKVRLVHTDTWSRYYHTDDIFSAPDDITVPMTISTTIATITRDAAFEIATQLSCNSDAVRNITFQGVKLTIFARLWAAGVRRGSVLTADAACLPSALLQSHQGVRELDLID